MWSARASRLAMRQAFSSPATGWATRSEEHTSELQSPCNIVCRLLLEKKNTIYRGVDLRGGLQTHLQNLFVKSLLPGAFSVQAQAVEAKKAPTFRYHPSYPHVQSQLQP